MVALLDVNVLIALFDGMHVYHEQAHQWFGSNRRLGWATCPLTENGFVRIISNPTYPGRGTNLPDAVSRLEEFREAGHHTFWRDSISVRDGNLFSLRHITSPKRLTDVYLLALSCHHEGRLATFDRSIALQSVPGAGPEHLALIGS